MRRADLWRLCLLVLFAAGLSKPALATSITFGQCASCGNPGQGLQVISHDLNPGAIADIAFVNNTFSYDPSVSGPISSIDVSVDKNISISQATPFTASIGNNFRPLIKQDGNFYLATVVGRGIPGALLSLCLRMLRIKSHVNMNRGIWLVSRRNRYGSRSGFALNQ